MFTWLKANFGTIIIGMVLLAVVMTIVIFMIKNKKKGKSLCGCGCGACPMSESCHQKK